MTLPSFSVSSPLASSYSVKTELVKPFFDTWEQKSNAANLVHEMRHPSYIAVK